MNETDLTERFRAGAATAVVALAAGVAGVAGSYGLAGFTPAFVVAPVERTLSREMPGAAVTFAITVLGDLGQTLNLVVATALVALLFAAVAVLAVAVARRLNARIAAPVWTTVGVWTLAVLLSGRPVPALGAAAGAGVVVGVAQVAGAVDSDRLAALLGETTADGNGRRRVVSALGAAAAAGVVGTAVGRSRSTDGSDAGDGPAAAIDGSGDGGGSTQQFDVAEQLATAEKRSFDIGGMDQSISEGFYKVDISSVDPEVDPGDWTLSVTGAVENEFDLTYEEVRGMDHEHRFVTLRCVGERLNGHKMDNALWTGVPVAPLVKRASPTSDCNCVMLRAGSDGFYEEFPIEALRPGMLAYGMNGRPLPRGHGAPVRALIPGHWGEINVKWLTEIEFLERERKGYWEKKGWHGTGPVKTVAKLHGKERREDGTYVVGGHAYAGTRGISKVEVSVADRPWKTAELTERLPGASGPAAAVGGGNDEFAADAWRLWRHTYDPPEGAHEVTVRAYERDGTRQPRESSSPFPSGPSGWVTETVYPSRL